MKRFFSLTVGILCTLFLVSCMEKDKFQEDIIVPDEEVPSFSNRSDVNVTINSEFEGELYTIYFDFPYNDTGDLVADHVFSGVTPIRETLSVPTHVKKLYIIGNGKMYVSDPDKVNINTLTTRASDITPHVISVINSQYYPEAKFNFKRDDLYKCTDLVIKDVPSAAEFEKAKAWITFIGDGGFYIGGGTGKLWMYTYPTAKRATLTAADCSFYGLKDGEIKPVTTTEMNKGAYPIFDSKIEVTDGNPSLKEVYLGEFAKGLSIGFAYKGNGYLNFSTPVLNPAITATLKYNDKEGLNYTIENKQVSNGYMQHLVIDDFEGNILGMENRRPGEAGYDGDYNDMLCLIKTDPVGIKPDEEVTPPAPPVMKLTEGYLIFEDNYPFKGDYDFNDVVVYYKVTDYYNSIDKDKMVEVKLLAKGASYTNDFGFYSQKTKTYIPMISGITGYTNVYQASAHYDLGISATMNFQGDIKPYLYNGKGYIFEEYFENTTYPYVLEIPYVTGSSYLWCQETHSIELAYPNYLRWREGTLGSDAWYVSPDLSHVFTNFPTVEP